MTERRQKGTTEEMEDLPIIETLNTSTVQGTRMSSFTLYRFTPAWSAQSPLPLPRPLLSPHPQQEYTCKRVTAIVGSAALHYRLPLSG